MTLTEQIVREVFASDKFPATVAELGEILADIVATYPEIDIDVDLADVDRAMVAEASRRQRIAVYSGAFRAKWYGEPWEGTLR